VPHSGFIASALWSTQRRSARIVEQAAHLIHTCHQWTINVERFASLQRFIQIINEAVFRPFDNAPRQPFIERKIFTCVSFDFRILLAKMRANAATGSSPLQ
jgi:hypothetical protein